MSREPNVADGSELPDRRPHHISSIAHLFFAEDESSRLVTGAGGELCLAVTCFNDSRIAAFAAGGLVMGMRQATRVDPGPAVRLVEDEGLMWSAGAFLVPAESPGDKGLKRLAGQWDWAVGTSVADQQRRVCWTHLRDDLDRGAVPSGYLGGGLAETCLEAVAAPPAPGAHGLVVCLLAHEVGALAVGVRLGRLLGQLAPAQLEILVFPDTWSVGGGAGGDRHWFRWSSGRGEDLLERCRELTRALGTACPVTITNLPSDDVPEALATTKAILKKVALRLTADFWVDPAL